MLLLFRGPGGEPLRLINTEQIIDVSFNEAMRTAYVRLNGRTGTPLVVPREFYGPFCRRLAELAVDVVAVTGAPVTADMADA